MSDSAYSISFTRTGRLHIRMVLVTALMAVFAVVTCAIFAMCSTERDVAVVAQVHTPVARPAAVLQAAADTRVSDVGTALADQEEHEQEVQQKRELDVELTF